MFGIRRWFLRRSLNLDSLPKDDNPLELVDIPEDETDIEIPTPRRRDVLLLLRLVFQHSIAERALALHLFYYVGHFRMMYFLPEGVREQDWGWLEMIPPPNKAVLCMIDLLRQMRTNMDNNNEGDIRYLHNRKVITVRCWSPNKEEAMVFFSDKRPSSDGRSGPGGGKE